MEDLEEQLQAVLASAVGQQLLERAFQAMVAPPQPREWRAAGVRGWHMGACLVLAKGLEIWLHDDKAELWGYGEWTDPQERPLWDSSPNRFYHRGYWDRVEHVLLGSGDYLIDAGGIYPKDNPERVLHWWQEEFGPSQNGVRVLAGLKVSLEEEGIRSELAVSQDLAKLLERELGSGIAWREELQSRSLVQVLAGDGTIEFSA